MINVIDNDSNLLSYIFIENKELLPAVRKVGRNIYIPYSREVITHFYVASANLIPEENQQKCLMDLNFFRFACSVLLLPDIIATQSLIEVILVKPSSSYLHTAFE